MGSTLGMQIRDAGSILVLVLFHSNCICIDLLTAQEVFWRIKLKKVPIVENERFSVISKMREEQPLNFIGGFLKQLCFWNSRSEKI